MDQIRRLQAERVFQVRGRMVPQVGGELCLDPVHVTYSGLRRDVQAFADIGEGLTSGAACSGPARRARTPAPAEQRRRDREAAHLQQAVAPHQVTVVTRDNGMRPKAMTWGLP